MFLYESFNRPAYNPMQQTPIAPPPGKEQSIYLFFSSKPVLNLALKK
jgi:hypothetical protein